MSIYRETLASAVVAVQVHSNTEHSWFGIRTPPLPKALKKTINGDEARTYLLHSIQQRLYSHWFRLGAAEAVETIDSAVSRSTMRSPFVTALSSANAGRGAHESGWKVHAIDAEHVVVERRGLRAWARPDEICQVAGRLDPGTAIAVRVPNELRNALPGFYIAIGDEELLPSEVAPIVRLYWNVVADAAPALMRSTTSRLNAAGVPFRFKMLEDPGRFNRCDAAVLYMPIGQFAAAAQVVAAIHQEVREDLGIRIPALTKHLGKGLALAEDPGGGDSFGLHRCRLVAEGIVWAHEHRLRSSHKRLAAVMACFRAAGLDGDKPYLNAGSEDTYSTLVRPAETGIG